MTFEDIAARMSDCDGDKVAPHVDPASTLFHSDADSTVSSPVGLTEHNDTTPISQCLKRSADEDDDNEDEDVDEDASMDDSARLSPSQTTSLSPSQTRVRKPLRKRAKTQEEKEQRAHERIMRNRLAAQTSRERKREYVQQLEIDNKDLQTKVKTIGAENKKLKSTVADLTKRLEQMERVLSFFSAPVVKTEPDEMALSAPVTPISNLGLSASSFGHTTIGAADTSSAGQVPISLSPHLSPALSSVDVADPALVVGLRSPAATARKDPQRRPTTTTTATSSATPMPTPSRTTTTQTTEDTRSFPWNLSTRSPAYRLMESLLLSWTTLLRATWMPACTRLISTYLRLRPLSLCSTTAAPTRMRRTATASQSRIYTQQQQQQQQQRQRHCTQDETFRHSRFELTPGALPVATDRARPQSEGSTFVHTANAATTAAATVYDSTTTTTTAHAANGYNALETTPRSRPDAIDVLLSKWNC